MPKPNQSRVSSLRSWIPPVAQPSEACLEGGKVQQGSPKLLNLSPRCSQLLPTLKKRRGRPTDDSSRNHAPRGPPPDPGAHSFPRPLTAENPVRGLRQWGTVTFAVRKGAEAGTWAGLARRGRSWQSPTPHRLSGW